MKLKITSQRLTIRNLKITDLTDFHFYRCNPDVTKYQGFDVFTIEEAEAFIEKQVDKEFGKAGEWVQYGIENKATGKIIGDCAIRLDQDDIRLAEIGITISHTKQKKGYAKEVLSAILDFLFSIDNFHRVSERVDAENVASIQLLKSVGFRKEGLLIENLFFKGKWGSEYHYAMLRREWEEINKKYIFQSARLGFRNWIESDKAKMTAINANPKVMEFFPNVENTEQTASFIRKMQQEFTAKGYCYFAVEELISKEFIGFIGLFEQTYEADFTPCVDIGWRLAQSQWNKGFATEGAKRCLEFAFNNIGLKNIKAICPLVNIKSEAVMKKIGMTKQYAFDHPLLKEYKEIENCLLYEIKKD